MRRIMKEPISCGEYKSAYPRPVTTVKEYGNSSATGIVAASGPNATTPPMNGCRPAALFSIIVIVMRCHATEKEPV